MTILLFHIILLGNLDDVAHFEIALIHFGNFKRGNRCAVENNPGFALQIFSCIILKFTLHDVLGMVFQLFQGTRIEECVCIDTPRLHFWLHAEKMTAAKTNIAKDESHARLLTGIPPFPFYL